MPLTTGALRKQRADKRKTTQNLATKVKYKGWVSKMRKKPSKEGLAKAMAELDRAARKKVIHPNKSARLKSRLAKLLKKGKS